eukprot:gnl/TRDRNA2_/TRDRNA2_60407_c0_seq2.p1 gnl/TRDRNA2_/TRDRNA2_60407_c0~~gnl/TRDRNA2_/TRDRNA2_60407_c0_seq2.p1  ORF type:complete len:227 (+),score=58.97 gnl/TRDRNA2_/TRDRNA2_60407_c0_seq2:133-813(+)
MIQDQDLKEIEQLILEMEGLEQKIIQIKEQQKFTEDIITAKQRRCQELRGQHEEKIRLLTRQARKARGHRKTNTGGAAGSPTSIEVTPGDPEVPNASPSSTLAALDMQLLDKAFGEEEWKFQLGLGDDQGSADGDGAARLAALTEVLQRRQSTVKELSRLLSRQQQSTDELLQNEQQGCFTCGRKTLVDEEFVNVRDQVGACLGQEAVESIFASLQTECQPAENMP